MVQMLLHFINGHEDRKEFIRKADRIDVCASIEDYDNEHTLVLYTDKTPECAELIKDIKQNPNIIIFDDKPTENKTKLRHYSHKKPDDFVEQTAGSNSNQRVDDLLTKNTPTPARTATYLAQRYNFPTQNGTPPVIGIISLGGTYLTNDLQYYWRNILNLSKIPTVKYVQVSGARNAPNQRIVADDGSDENTLDIEIVGGTCPGCTIVVYFAPNTLSGFYNAFYSAINDSVNKPSIISCSWGMPEQYWPVNTMIAYDQLFKTAVAKGITICAASGDNSSDDGDVNGLPHVDFPSSSSYVVACGGTSLLTVVETTWSYNPTYDWGTGGGISAQFTAPSYQNGIVVYPNVTVPSTTYLRGKRALPDVAMNGDPLSGWALYFNGARVVYGGTSCVAPAMSGLLGLINLKYTTSFLSNLYGIYSGQSRRTSFNDITVGSNDSIKGSVGIWNAGVGFDMCTGMGTPNGTGLYNALKLRGLARHT
jgi:kumamolisin